MSVQFVNLYSIHKYLLNYNEIWVFVIIMVVLYNNGRAYNKNSKYENSAVFLPVIVLLNWDSKIISSSKQYRSSNL